MVAARVLHPVLLALALLGPLVASAESPPDHTGTGSGPNATITAPNTTATGVTKPPGVEEGPETPHDRRELERIERENDRIDDSVCEGCK